MKNSQQTKKFYVVEISIMLGLLLVVFGMLGGFGYVVYKQYESTKQTTDEQQQQPTETPTNLLEAFNITPPKVPVTKPKFDQYVDSASGDVFLIPMSGNGFAYRSHNGFPVYKSEIKNFQLHGSQTLFSNKHQVELIGFDIYCDQPSKTKACAMTGVQMFDIHGILNIPELKEEFDKWMVFNNKHNTITTLDSIYSSILKYDVQITKQVTKSMEEKNVRK